MQPIPVVSAVVASLRAQGIDVPPGRVRIDGYGDSPELSASLLALIRDGRKRARTSLLWAIEANNESLPQVGDIEIVVDHENEPAFITRLTDVQVVPYHGGGRYQVKALLDSEIQDLTETLRICRIVAAN